MQRSALSLLMTLALLGPLATAAAAQTTFIPAGADWRYLDDGSNQGTAWRDPAHSDGSWASGPAELGYGDGDEATVVDFGGDWQNKHITTYFRHTFSVANPASVQSLTLGLLRDDGGVAYLNGTEVFRSNMPSGTIDYLTVAAAAGGSESTFFETSVDPALLVSGDNVMAVEVHQRSGGSSDLSFNLDLVGDVSAGSASVVRGPYLQRATPTSLVVRWRTDVATDSRVSYGDAPGNLGQFTDGAGVTTEHEVELLGLLPDTTYYYAVGTTAEALAGADASTFFVTPPPVGTPKPTRIWVIGDSGSANQNARDVRDTYFAWNGGGYTDLWLMLGDNAYETGTDAEYQAAVFDIYPQVLRQTPLWPTLGNHDGHTADSATQTGPYYDVFTLPKNGEAGGFPSGTEAYYSFDYGNLHFIVLESHETDRSPGGAMMSWLAADVASTAADWVIAFWHHPPYSKGSHDSDLEGQLVDMRENAVPVLESYGVDLVLAGHSHVYERSFLLDSHYGDSTSLTGAMVLDGGDGRPGGDGAYQKPTAGAAPHEGAVYVVAGNASKTSPGPLNHPAMYYSIRNLGSLVLDVDGNTLDAVSLDENGGVLDTFTIVKGTGGGGPDASVAGLAWDDQDGDGIQDAGEPGLAGVAVELFDGQGAAQGSTTTTAGGYLFSNLAAGDYYVAFTAPAGKVFSPQDVGGDDTLDSDPDSLTGETATFTLAASEARDFVDAGFADAGGGVDTIFNDDFNGGDLSEWTSTQTDGSDLAVTTAAALEGSHGLQALIDGTGAIWARDTSPAAETTYRAKLILDPNGLTIPNWKAFHVFRAWSGSPTWKDLMGVILQRTSSGAYRIRGEARRDDNSLAQTSWKVIADQPTEIEIEWRAASAPGADDGSCTLWIDGVQHAELTGLDNEARLLETVKLGAVAGIDTGTSGTFYLDAFESWRP